MLFTLSCASFVDASGWGIQIVFCDKTRRFSFREGFSSKASREANPTWPESRISNKPFSTKIDPLATLIIVTLFYFGCKLFY